MKKSILGIFVLGICVLAMSSCKKDYTCDCSTEFAGTTTNTSVAIENAKKSDAEDACNALGVSSTTTCTLK